MKNDEKALIVLSGGQDSATCLALAIEKYSNIYTITFDYNQRHRREIVCAAILARNAAVSHTLIPVTSLTKIGNSSLITKSMEYLPWHPNNEELPATFVPGRNMLFLTLACAYAYTLDITEVITGVCQTDYSGYPDCRDESIHAVNEAVNLCMAYQFNILTPLMYMTKADTVRLMDNMGKLHWYKSTHTCYEGGSDPCMKCDACKLRAKGFAEAGIEDPLIAEEYK